MDVAGAVGWTALFPFIAGFITWLVYIFWKWETGNIRGPIIDRRLIIATVTLIVIAMIMWIVAIWMGYAQGAA